MTFDELDLPLLAGFESIGTLPGGLRHVLARTAAHTTDPPTVASVAQQCGYRHMSRFAEHYAARYGGTPRETLAGARFNTRATGPREQSGPISGPLSAGAPL